VELLVGAHDLAGEVVDLGGTGPQVGDPGGGDLGRGVDVNAIRTVRTTATVASRTTTGASAAADDGLGSRPEAASSRPSGA
jgi:hypothetical protein